MTIVRILLLSFEASDSDNFFKSLIHQTSVAALEIIVMHFENRSYHVFLIAIDKFLLR